MTQKNSIPEGNHIVLNNSEVITDYLAAKKLCSIYSSANSRGIPCSITLRKVKVLLNTNKCYYTGVIFDDTVNIRSIDRVDNTKGYTDKNTVVSSVNFNRKKANLTVEEIICLYKKVNQFINPKTNVKKSTISSKKGYSSKNKRSSTINKSRSFKESSETNI